MTGTFLKAIPLSNTISTNTTYESLFQPVYYDQAGFMPILTTILVCIKFYLLFACYSIIISIVITTIITIIITIICIFLSVFCFFTILFLLFTVLSLLFLL